jgi:predicted O-linked N-acetylglucosamine transferase (SPINDLY family)
MSLRPLFEKAIALHRAGDLAQAEALYRQILRAEPGNFPSLHMLGYLEGQRGRFAEAIGLLRRALQIAPDDRNALTHYGHALLQAGQNEEALAVYDQVLALRPDAVDVLYNRSVILSGLGRPGEALAALDRALMLQPNAAMILYSRGVVMTQLLRHQEALANYDRALALDPKLGLARGNRAMAALNICDFARAGEIGSEMVEMVRTGVPFAPLNILGTSQDKALHRRCAENMLQATLPPRPAPLWNGEVYRHDRTRLAYVSPDFREHAVAFQIAQLIETHDRSRFEVIGISTGADDQSAIRARLMGAFDQFHDVRALGNEAVARQMRAMEVDIAVDLGGHTSGSRLEIFAWRPAPIQVTWLGYPGTTGADFFHYLIGDAIVTPAQDQPFYSEQLVALPDIYFPTDAGRAIGAMPSRAEAGLPPESFVFCAFNNGWKITQPVFAVWMRLLAAVPGSVLWLKHTNAAAAKNLQREAQARGLDPARLVFAPDAPLDVHLARQALADLFLDTLPYNGHATTADALWAGLPVLTCKGEAFAGRVAASMLQAVGLPELVTQSLDDYEALALQLARDPARLAALKHKLKDNLPTAPLFDQARFRANIEAAYLAMRAR